MMFSPKLPSVTSGEAPGHLCLEVFYGLIRKQAHLPVPFAGVGVALDTVVLDQVDVRYRLLGRALGPADTDCFHCGFFVHFSIFLSATIVSHIDTGKKDN